MEALNLFGAIASIIGAILAWWSAAVARTAAQEAERVRAELQSRVALGDLAELYALERQALSAVSKYGPGSRPESTAGADPDRDAADVRNYLTGLERHKAAFGARAPNVADRLCTKVYGLLNQFANAGTDADRQTAGGTIYIELNGFSHRLKAQLERHRMNA